jgi:cytosine/creatinine deaminase
VIAETPERVSALHLDGRPKTVNGADYAPKI